MKGVLLDSAEYAKGKLHGWERHWQYDTGKLRYELHYTHGVLDHKTR